ncbi:recombinase family protein [Nocardia sp. NPDC052278]|uniref:recombinase family protein n=1 Tax=unclassified Nocardia TaxID=2637762 RepID=UPI00368355A3
MAGFARPGDRLTVSGLYRLCRDLADILAVRDWCRQHGVKLRVLSGALSGITDLAATDATTTMLVNVLISVGQFQRDLQNELTREGLAAAWAQGARSGRRPQVATIGALEQVRQEFRDGASIAALARRHRVSRGAIRTAVADLLPGRLEHPAPAGMDEPGPIRIEMPGKIVCHLTGHSGDLGETERHALQHCRDVRRRRCPTENLTRRVHRVIRVSAGAAGPDHLGVGRT